MAAQAASRGGQFEQSERLTQDAPGRRAAR